MTRITKTMPITIRIAPVIRQTGALLVTADVLPATAVEIAVLS